MFKLTDDLVDKIEIGGEIFPLNLSFDTVLLFYDLLDDETVNDEHKIELAFEMFVIMEQDDEFASYDNYDFNVKFTTIQKIVEQFVSGAEGDETESSEGSSKKLYDLGQDAPYIYSSFVQEYGIDLLDQQGILRWEKFIALLRGLRDTTKFKDIINIRGTKIPKRTKYNTDEIEQLKAQKKMYELTKSRDEREDELNAMFDKLVGGS